MDTPSSPADERTTLDGDEARAARTQDGWNERARAEAIREFGAVRAADLADAPSWIDQGLIFGVRDDDGLLISGICLEGGSPRLAMRRVLSALDGSLEGWEVLLWLTGSNGYLDGARPADLLDTDIDAVVEAARYQSALSTD